MLKNVASGALAGAATVASTVVGLMWQTIDPAIGKWILIACAAVFIIAVVLFLRPGKGESEGIAQMTHGPNSPAVGTWTGDYINHPPPADRQERKQAQAPKYRVPAGPELSRILKSISLREPTPDVPLTGVLVRVYKALGGAPSQNIERAKFYRKVDHAVADTVAIHSLHVWGRIGDQPLTLIPPERWQEGTFNHRQATFTWVGPFSPVIYADLRFNNDEIESCYPRAE